MASIKLSISVPEDQVNVAKYLLETRDREAKGTSVVFQTILKEWLQAQGDILENEGVQAILLHLAQEQFFDDSEEVFD